MSVEIERYRIVEQLPDVDKAVRGRYWLYGLGGYGTKLAARTARQLEYSRVPELAAVTLQDMDSQQMRNVARIVAPSARVPVIYLDGLGVNDFHDQSEGRVRATIERSWASRSDWIPMTDDLVSASVRRLEIDLVSPAANLIEFSCGGHLIQAAYVAYRTAIEFPKAKRIGITAIPDDPKTAAEFLKFLDNISVRDANSEFPWQADERAEPLFHHLLLTHNGLDPKTHDRLIPMTLAALASKVRAEQAGSESLLNVLELLRLHKVPAKETSYLTLEYAIDPIPVKTPRKPCWFGRAVLRRPVLAPYTDTPVLSARTDSLMSTLLTGHGTPTFNVPTEDSAMIISIPSSDVSWRQVHQVETQISEVMKHREGGDLGAMHGPYWGRYPIECSPLGNPVEPLAAVVVQRIHNGRVTVKQAIVRDYPEITALLPSATLPLGLLTPLEVPAEVIDLSQNERSA